MAVGRVTKRPVTVDWLAAGKDGQASTSGEEAGGGGGAWGGQVQNTACLVHYIVSGFDSLDM